LGSVSPLIENGVNNGAGSTLDMVIPFEGA